MYLFIIIYVFERAFFFLLFVSIFLSSSLSLVFGLDAPLSSLSLLSLSYLEICSMVPLPPQFPPPPLFFEICSFVSGGTRWMEEEEKQAFNP